MVQQQKPGNRRATGGAGEMRRAAPHYLDQENIDDQIRGELTCADGRFTTTSRFGKRTNFRPVFSNWRTGRDVDEFAFVLVGPGQNLS